mmetsp:Transcript_10997/g.23497  ORF Transcript_10997/g.23497 Transcript_10997/m.23497 type:complete len:211 (+) Transcript_10997:722-1354(+)
MPWRTLGCSASRRRRLRRQPRACHHQLSALTGPKAGARLVRRRSLRSRSHCLCPQRSTPAPQARKVRFLVPRASAFARLQAFLSIRASLLLLADQEYDRVSLGRYDLAQLPLELHAALTPLGCCSGCSTSASHSMYCQARPRHCLHHHRKILQSHHHIPASRRDKHWSSQYSALSPQLATFPPCCCASPCVLAGHLPFCLRRKMQMRLQS